MNRLRRTLLVGHAGLTSVMLLIAGVPYAECYCPNGHFKPICFGIGCGTAHCGPAPERNASEHAQARKAKLPCCCQHKPEAPARGRPSLALRACADTASKRPLVQSPGCIKHIVQPNPMTSPPAKVAYHHDVSLTADEMPPVVPGVVILDGTLKQNGWQLHLLGPPTDLVIVLQHFLI
jgi:hypothetical protein